MKISGILFDLDETLHSRDAAFWRWIQVEAGTRLVDRHRVAELDAKGRGPKDLLVDYLAQQFAWPEASLEARLARFRAGVALHTQTPPLLLEVLNALRTHFRLGLISNGSGAAQRAKLIALGLEGYFDPVLISEELGYRKPQPEIFWLAAERWQVNNNAILVVGDDETADIQGALNAGMHALRVGDSAAGSSPCIPSIAELQHWLAMNTRSATSHP